MVASHNIVRFPDARERLHAYLAGRFDRLERRLDGMAASDDARFAALAARCERFAAALEYTAVCVSPPENVVPYCLDTK